MLTIRGVVALPVRKCFFNAKVLVRLLDASVIDAPARLVGETCFPFSGGSVDRIPFKLAFDEASGGGRMILSAEIRTKDPALLQNGDWVTTRTANVLIHTLEEKEAVVSVELI